MRKLSLLILLGLASCTSAVMLQDPKSGSVYECSHPNMYGLQYTEANETCASALETQGWKRLTPKE